MVITIYCFICSNGKSKQDAIEQTWSEGEIERIDGDCFIYCFSMGNSKCRRLRIEVFLYYVIMVMLKI